MASSDAKVRLDLNNLIFQANLLTLQKPERHAALDTLNKIRQLPLTVIDQRPSWLPLSGCRRKPGMFMSSIDCAVSSAAS